MNISQIVSKFGLVLKVFLFLYILFLFLYFFYWAGQFLFATYLTLKLVDHGVGIFLILLEITEHIYKMGLLLCIPHQQYFSHSNEYVVLSNRGFNLHFYND